MRSHAFLSGPGFEKMRDDLRRSCNEIWVVDCSPEGHQPDVPTRVFQGVQQPVCIVLAARRLGKGAHLPARVQYYSLRKGRREEKFVELNALSLDNPGWAICTSGWRDSFLPESGGVWSAYPALDDFFSYNGSGVMPGRTWIIAPDSASLHARWTILAREKDKTKKDELFYPHQNGDKTAGKRSSKGLTGHEHRSGAVEDDGKACIAPVRYAFRSFDRQWIIPDNRLINRANPTLWDSYSQSQVYITALEDPAPTSGPAISFAGSPPDLNHYKGSAGGRVYLTWRDASATVPNVKPAVLVFLSQSYGEEIGAEAFVAYLAATLAHSAFTARFASDLVRPGLRVPLTADRTLFRRAVELGQEVIWLHTFGERSAAGGRPAGAPRQPKAEAPRLPANGAIPGAPEPLPEEMDYDADGRRLRIGKGFIENVPREVWEYEVSGKNVLRQWFSYRRLDRTRPVIGERRPPSALDKVQPEGWTAEYTSDLLDLLNVLGRLVLLQPKQAQLLDEICENPLISADQLQSAGAFVMSEVSTTVRTVNPNSNQGRLL
jgi:hypothetical protein